VLAIIRMTSVALFGALLSMAATACVGDLVELTPGQHHTLDGGGGGSPDLTPANPATDDMGPAAVPKFNPDIMSDLRSMGCLVGCHTPPATQQPIMQDSTDPATIMTVYDNVKARAMNGENSPILTKLLATNTTVTHGGGKPITSTSDPKYVRLLAWVNGGTPP
jgi:hypothetical protein